MNEAVIGERGLAGGSGPKGPCAPRFSPALVTHLQRSLQRCVAGINSNNLTDGLDCFELHTLQEILDEFLRLQEKAAENWRGV